MKKKEIIVRLKAIKILLHYKQNQIANEGIETLIQKLTENETEISNI